MSKRSQEKRTARAKEKAKSARRARGMSPLSRLAGDGDNIECWLQYQEADQRMVSALVLRPMHGGGSAAAMFLVDYDCIGVKDAFCRFDVSPSEIVAGFRAQAEEDGSTVVKVEGARMRSILAGALRWGNEHGFRMPAALEKCLRVVGGTVDAAGADVSEFGTEEGGLRYVGRRRDLERLLGEESVEEFMDRDDVECVFVDEGLEEAGSDFDDEEDEDGEEDLSEEIVNELSEELIKMNDTMLQEIIAWLQTRGETPRDELSVALNLQMVASMGCLARGELDMNVQEAMEEVLDQMEKGPELDALRAAHQQIVAYVEATKGSLEGLTKLNELEE